MCSRYVSSNKVEMERAWHVGARDHWRGGSVLPRKLGPFIRADADGGREFDKRSVVALEPADWDSWLRAPVDEAQALVRLSTVDTFDAGPEAAPGAV